MSLYHRMRCEISNKKKIHRRLWGGLICSVKIPMKHEYAGSSMDQLSWRVESYRENQNQVKGFAICVNNVKECWGEIVLWLMANDKIERKKKKIASSKSSQINSINLHEWWSSMPLIQIRDICFNNVNTRSFCVRSKSIPMSCGREGKRDHNVGYSSLYFCIIFFFF